MYLAAQCWDDGNVSDLRIMELCRKYGAKATFNITPGRYQKQVRTFARTWEGFDIWRFSLNEIASVYEDFPLASHTMTHPHPTQIPPEVFRREALDARKYIEDLRQCEARGFAWPFGEYNQTCVEILREEGFVYGRTCANTDRVVPCEEPLAAATSTHWLNPDFELRLKTAKESGVFYFWGHSYEMKDDPRLWARYEEILRVLSSDPEAVWVDVMELFRKRS